MDADHRKQVRKKVYGARRLLFAGLPFFAAGVLVASGYHGTQASFAGDIREGSPLTPSALTAMPTSFAELADKLSPAVVNIKVTKIEQAANQGQQFQRDPFGDFFEGMPRGPEKYRTQGAGSGVIISKDGYILSNNHVVEGAKEVTVTLADQKEYEAEVVGRDPKTDLAVLKIKADLAFPTAKLGDSENLRVGDWVVAIGNPFGLNHTVTSGIVSAKGRVIGAGPYDDFIQTDASINPGNSGGPLFNTRGEVVGINTAIIPQGQGIGFAIPIDTAKPLIPQLVEHGEITRGYLGVNIQTITPDLAQALEIEETTGALVADVEADSPAAKSGIKNGDIIVTFDGKTIKDSRDLSTMVAGTPVGEKVPLTVLRNGDKLELSVTVEKLSAGEPLLGSSDAEKGRWGLHLHDLNPRIEEQFRLKADQGVAVVGIEPDSPAAEAGIRQGDVIVEVNRKRVASVDDVKKEIKQAKEKDRLLLLVQRDGGKFYVPLEQQG